MAENDTHKKCFFFDIDGTLVPFYGSKEIADSTKKAIRELQAAGHFCAIATGRAQYQAAEIGDLVDIDNLVSDGGNGITLNGQLLRLTPLPHEACVSLADECDQKGLLWAIADRNLPVCRTKFPEYQKIMKDKYTKAEIVPTLDLRNVPEIYKMFILCDQEEEAGLLASSGLQGGHYAPNLLLIEPMNKEKGIQEMVSSCAASPEDVVVFGDSENDLSMFRPEWTGIAMGNAIPALKERATFVTKSVTEDGIAYALHHFGWI